MWIQKLELINNVVDQIYYPFDHLAWAKANGILVKTRVAWSELANYCWALSLFLHAAKATRYLTLLASNKDKRR